MYPTFSDPKLAEIEEIDPLQLQVGGNQAVENHNIVFKVQSAESNNGPIHK